MATLSDIKDKIVYFQTSATFPSILYIPIHPIKVSNTRSKKITKRTPSQSSQNSALEAKDTKIKDKLKIENVYEIDGWIEPIETGDTDGIFFTSTKTAYQIKQEFFKYIFNNNSKPSNFFMNYEGRQIYGAVEKVDISEECMDKTTTQAPKYSIKFIFVAVENAIGSEGL